MSFAGSSPTPASSREGRRPRGARVPDSDDRLRARAPVPPGGDRLRRRPGRRRRDQGTAGTTGSGRRLRLSWTSWTGGSYRIRGSSRTGRIRISWSSWTSRGGRRDRTSWISRIDGRSGGSWPSRTGGRERISGTARDPRTEGTGRPRMRRRLYGDAVRPPPNDRSDPRVPLRRERRPLGRALPGRGRDNVRPTAPVRTRG
jgi:hypothetical protein